MVIILKQNADKQQFENLVSWLEAQSIKVHISEGINQTIVGLVGDDRA